MHPSTSLVLAAVLLVSATAPVSGLGTATTPAIDQPRTQATSADLASSASVPTDGEDACAPLATESEASDPDQDVLGWENGCWYNESIAVDRENGLNRTERDAVVARTMARVELVRQLEFNRTVPVEAISREEYAERTAEQFESESSSERLRKNVKWEALMMVDENTDAVEVERSNTVAGVGGYYSLDDDRIFVVSDNQTAPKIDEATLAHELVHALQSQRFDVSERFGISNFDSGGRTTESLNALNGLLEGDAELLELRYLERCEGEWDCLPPVSRNGSDSERHPGIYFVNAQPYSDGPKFVDSIYEKRGWDGVNDAYRNPPTSSKQVIDPEAYPDEEPTNVSFTDTSGDDWRVLDSGTDRPEYVSFGMPGVTSMLIYPLYDSGEEDEPVMPPRLFFNSTPEGLSSYDPMKYENNPFASGWDGDKLYPYVTSDSAETGETGYVWKLAWESEADAERFVEGYTTLLKYYNATAVEGREDTYRIPSGDRYADAYYLDQSGETVTIVNAPSVEDLSQVRDGAAPEVERTTTTETDTSPGVPGFGATAALAGLAAAVLVAHRRR